MKRLVVFTASFPYGEAEPFLEDEIIYLCNQFEEVVIIPLAGYRTECRTVPENCVFINPVMKNKLWKAVMGLFNIKTIISIIGISFFIIFEYN